jgi:hypothetical protein
MRNQLKTNDETILKLFKEAKRPLSIPSLTQTFNICRFGCGSTSPQSKAEPKWSN